jgi:glyoxylate/hydroxypyruvate reductase A
VRLLIKSGGEEAVPEWRAAFAGIAPHLDVRWWDDRDVDPATVDFALVWDPEPGRLAALPKLRAIFGAGAGVDYILRDPLLPAAVPLVRCVPPEATQRMGEFAVWAVLSLNKDARRMAIAQAGARWDAFDPPFAAAERTVGVMGLGAMGMRAAQMIAGLGIPVVGWSRTRKMLPGIETFSGDGERDAFLARCGVLVCLLPATPETAGILAAPLFAKLPRGAGLVQLGRGMQQSTRDVVAALDSGQLSGAVLDVFEQEPPPGDSPIWSHPKIIVTPHAASTPSRQERARYVAGCIAGLERGEALPNLYSPERGY